MSKSISFIAVLKVRDKSVEDVENLYKECAQYVSEYMNKNITACMIPSIDVSRLQKNPSSTFTFIGSMDPKNMVDERQYKNAVYELFKKLRIKCESVIDLNFYDTDYFRMK